METIKYAGKTLTLDYPAQLDNYRDGVAWYATAHDADGNRYEIRWDYIEPAWAESLTPEEKNDITDLSEFADWEHPAEVREKKNMKKLKEGWHIVAGYSVYVDSDGMIRHGTKKDQNGSLVLAYPYYWDKKYNCWNNAPCTPSQLYRDNWSLK